MMLACLGLAAVPGTISFQAKELFLYGIYHAASEQPLLWIVMAMTVVTAICNVAIAVRVITTLMGWKGGMIPADAPDSEADAVNAGFLEDYDHAWRAGTHLYPGIPPASTICVTSTACKCIHQNTNPWQSFQTSAQTFLGTYIGISQIRSQIKGGSKCQPCC